MKLVGTSLPPEIHLNLETLDMDRVYINKMYNYEIVAINKGKSRNATAIYKCEWIGFLAWMLQLFIGHVNGVIVYKEVPILFGSRITCCPEMHCLRPGEKEIFVISFCNSNQGPYFEEINFAIRDTKVILKLYLK